MVAMDVFALNRRFQCALPILADYFHKAIVKMPFSAFFSFSHDFRHTGAARRRARAAQAACLVDTTQ
jgi:hypothetical protein